MTITIQLTQEDIDKTQALAKANGYRASRMCYVANSVSRHFGTTDVACGYSGIRVDGLTYYLLDAVGRNLTFMTTQEREFFEVTPRTFELTEAPK